MTSERDNLSKFRDAYLDFLEGGRDEPPVLEDLPEEQRRAAKAFIDSITAARGVDPYASRPSIEQLLASRYQTNGRTRELGEVLQNHLRLTVDHRALVTPDAASAAVGLASALVIQARGMRIRVVPEASSEDLDYALTRRAEDIARVFSNFPDTHAVLFTTTLEASERAIAEMTEGAVTARSVINAAEQAVRLLGGDHAVCPTCIRPLPPDERASAISVHRTQRGEAQAEARRLEEARGARQTHAQAVTRLLAQLEALEPPSIDAEDVNVPTRAEAEASYQQASAALDEHNQQLGGVKSRLESLKAQIASDDQIRQEERNLRLAYRREAAALAGASVLRKAADHVIESRIEPLAIEVRGRWKHLFTNNGLTFRPDGSITRLRDGEELGWDTLSGGEQTWARIVTHLIVMATTTSLPFAWFDEPLEPLNPQLRHAVAATLATATRGGNSW